MAWYRAYFLNDSRRIADVEEFPSVSDDQALGEAQSRLARRGGFMGFELWQGALPVFLYPQHQVA